MILKYKDIDVYYGLLWDFDDFDIREFYSDELDNSIRHNVHHHVHSTFKGEGDGHFTNVYLRPIALKPNSSKTIYGMVCHGSKFEVGEMLLNFHNHTQVGEQIYQSNKSKIQNSATPAADPYLFSRNLLAATTLTNVVYPVYLKKILH